MRPSLFVADCVGFTGTSRGMTSDQKEQLRIFLQGLRTKGFQWFRHGDCIGSDAQAARIAKDLGYQLIAHPGFPAGKPEETKYRAFTDFNDQVYPVKEFIKRNHDIVRGCCLLVAAPYQNYEVNRSGTWATVRFANSLNPPVRVGFVYPGRNRMSSIHLKES